VTLPEGWEEAPLLDVVDLHDSRRVPLNAAQRAAMPGSYPYYGANGQVGSVGDYLFEGKHILVAEDGGYFDQPERGVAYEVDGRFWVNNHAHILSTCGDMPTGFITRLLNTIDWPQYVSGTTRLKLTQGGMQRIRLPVPPLAEQRRIVAKLDALTARFARARSELDRVPDLSERQHLSILRAGMRGQLTTDWRMNNTAEPVASLLARYPPPQQGRGGREATDKVIPGVAGLSVNDPGTDLPDGWAWVPLLRIAKQETGHTPSRSKPDYWDGGVPWIGIRDAGAHHGRSIEDTAQTISDAGLANSSARMLTAGTVCLSRTASVGYVTIMARSMATSQDFATWTCTEALLPEYLMYALMAEGDEIRNFGMGTTHTTIYFPEVRAFHIALPPIEEQKEIVARIRAAIVRANRLEAEAARARALLARLESELLAKAFRGELVPQDPNDEPAQDLLDRIRTERAAAPQTKRGRKAKEKTKEWIS